MPEETEVTPAADQPPEDFAAYEKWANDRNDPGLEVEAEEDIPSEEAAPSETPAEEPEVESAEESETSTEEEQEEETEETETDEQGGRGVQRRIGKLTKKIRELEARLKPAEPAAKPEVATPPAAEKKPDDGKPVAPKLADFPSYEEYEAAHAEFVEKLTDWKADQKESARKADEALERAKADQVQRDNEWAEAAKEYPDFNEVVGSDEVKISAAMEATMKLSPDGVHLAYYLGKHPEESLRIAKLTLADNEAQWRVALARAGRELGKIEAKLEKTPPKKEATKAAPAPPPKPKQVTSAPKPPARVGGTRAAPPPDIHNEDTAADYSAWEKAREAHLKRR